MIRGQVASVCVPDLILTIMAIGIFLMMAGVFHRGLYLIGVVLSVGAFVSIFKYV